MGGLARWLWSRWRRQFALASCVVAIAFMTTAIAVPCAVVSGVWFELTWTESAVILVVITAVQVVGTIVGFARNPLMETVQAWGRGDESMPAETHRAALNVVRSATVRTLVVCQVLHVAVTIPLVVVMGELRVGSTLALVVALEYALVAVGVMMSLGLRQLLWPVLAEVSPLVPLGASATSRGWGIRTQLLAGMISATTICGIGTGAAVARFDARETQFVAIAIVSTLWGGYLVALLTWGLINPLVGPIRDLTDATRRTRMGDFDRRLQVTTTDELGDLTAAFNEMQHGLAEREALHAAFGSYVDPLLAQRLIDSGSSMFEGEDVVVTVLFADVRDFTSFAEGVDPAVAVELLNRLFDVVVPVLHARGGNANHYLGDGLLAIFGAPNPLEQHADAAVAAALEIHRRVQAEFGTALRLGIGINTGRVIAGTVGGGGRHEFTVIGDTVNIAARVEQLTKETGDAILITDATRAALSTPRPRSTTRGGFDLKGKSAAVTLHAVRVPRQNR